MNTAGLTKYMKNPTLGLIPFISFLLTFLCTLNAITSLFVSLTLAFVLDIFLRFVVKSKIANILIFMTLLPLLLAFVTEVLFGAEIESVGVFVVLTEIYLVCVIMLLRLMESYIKKNPYWDRHRSQKPFLTGFFHVATLIQYTFTVHLFYMLIYVYLRTKGTVTSLDQISYVWIPTILALLLIFYENIRIKRISIQLSKEEWLPIVNEKGEVSGKIAKSETIKLKDRFMHPVIRIAFVYKGDVYLQQRAEGCVIDGGLLDHPLKKYVPYGRDINAEAHKMVADVLSKSEGASFKFLLKYAFRNEDTNRLVFLYALTVENEEDLEKYTNLHGKFWTKKHIEENQVKNLIFSECFLLEYEYIKNTLLIAQSIRRNSNVS